jgi:hypothetical protein
MAVSASAMSNSRRGESWLGWLCHSSCSAGKQPEHAHLVYGLKNGLENSACPWIPVAFGEPEITENNQHFQ